MAQITDEIDEVAPEGQAPSLQTVSPTDFGLKGTAQDLGMAETAVHRAQSLAIRAQAATDQKTIAPDVSAMKAANDEDVSAMMAGYKPGDGGLTTAATALATDRAQRFATNPNYTPGQRSEMTNAGLLEAQRVSAMAAQHQAATDAAPIAEATAAVQAQARGQGLITADQQFQTAAHDLRLNSPPGDPSLPQKTLDLYDQATTAAVAAASPADAPYIAGARAAQRPQVYSQAQEFQLAGATDQLHIATNKQVGDLVNTVTLAPTSYANARDVLLPQIVANAPAAWRPEIQKDAEQQLAAAHLRGLNAAGPPGSHQAQQEIDAGLFNKVLPPEALEALKSETAAAVRGNAPLSVDQAISHDQAVQAARDSLTSIMATGKEATGVTLDGLTGILSQGEAASFAVARTEALRTFAAVGGVRAMTGQQLAALRATPAPDASDPNYSAHLLAWKAQQQAAADEMQARTADPAAWAFAASNKAPATKGMAAVGTGNAQTRGDALQQAWQGVLNPTDGSGHAAGNQLAGWSLGAQYAAGVPSTARTIVPQTYAASVAAGVTAAPPEGRLQALGNVAAIMGRLPNSITLPDGSQANPRAMFGAQLLKAGLNPAEYSALVDFGGDATGAKLGRVVAAENVAAQKPLDKNDATALKAAVTAQLTPWLNQVAAMPGNNELYQARIDRTAMVAHGLMVTQGLSVGAAAKAAAADLVGGQVNMGTFSVPQTAAPTGDDQTLIRKGTGLLQAALTSNNGQYLARSSPDGQGLNAAKIQQTASWRTLPDGSGLVLMVPKTDGSYTPVPDVYGRPVQFTFGQIKDFGAQGVGGVMGKPNPFASAPPTTPRAQDGTPVPAFTKSAAFQALAAGIEHNESGGRSGLISSAGAYGVRQVRPDTARPYAQKLFGQPLDLHRLQYDDGYNRQISNAILGDLVNHYGTGNGLGLAAAAYFAGQGNIDGYTDNTGYHPGLLQTHGDPRNGQVSLDQWVRAVGEKSPKTAKYVPGALYYALSQLRGQH